MSYLKRGIDQTLACLVRPPAQARPEEDDVVNKPAMYWSELIVPPAVNWSTGCLAIGFQTVTQFRHVGFEPTPNAMCNVRLIVVECQRPR